MSTPRRLSIRNRDFRSRSLTVRELEILHLTGMGLSPKSAAKSLGISAGTVKWHMKNLFQKLDANSREEALQKARAQNLIESRLFCPVCACAMAVRKSVSAELNLLPH